MIKIVFILLLLFACIQDVEAKQKRNRAEVYRYKATHVCPATGRHSYRCPGYVVDHIRPLACGGPDKTYNMQYQSIAAGKAKDKWERKGCKKRWK